MPSSQPSGMPTSNPSAQPSGLPTTIPTGQPSSIPSSQPSSEPSSQPSAQPSSKPSSQPSIEPTGLPTTTPSSQPTTQPTALPSSQPSSKPSYQPTAQPTAQPTSVPRSKPSGQPTGQPTGQPSRQPTVQPTSKPSGQPTTQPTSKPSNQPTAEPSGQPSGQPTTQPTLAPTGQPTGSPSSQPTLTPSTRPSSQPSSRPSEKPTTPPTSQPSGQPLSVPSSQPIANPSSEPTGQPTTQPTSSPSFWPTRQSPAVARKTHAPVTAIPNTVTRTPAPTQSKETILSNGLQQDLVKISANATILYQDIIVGGSLTKGGCNPWQVGSGSSLVVKSVSQKTLSVGILTVDISQIRRSVYCRNSALSSRILEAVATRSNSSSVNCDSHMWKSKKCANRQLAVCIDCNDPCSSADCTDLLSLNPCASKKDMPPACTGVNAYRLLFATFQPFSVAPIIDAMSYAANKTSVTISLALRTDGLAYCAAYKAGVRPSSVTSIIIQNQMATSSLRAASLTISNLAPATTYDVFCATASSLGVVMDLADSLRSSIIVVTECCKTISMSLGISTLYKDTSAINAVYITLDAPPSSSLLLTIGTSNINAPQMISVLIPASTVLTSMTITLSYSFSLSSASSLTLGNHTVVASTSGPSAGEYNILYATSPYYSVISAETPPVTPFLVRAEFSTDGSSITAFFSADTNKAGVTATSFQCNLLFTFPGVGAASCKWGSLSTVEIVLGSAAVIKVGQYVTLQPRIIKAACVTSTVFCSKWSTATGNSVAVTAPSTAVTPTVLILAPAILGGCDALRLDLSNSEGGGGRPWSNVSFAVSSSGDASAAQAFLNAHSISNGLPVVVPSGSFPVGVNNIKVVLCNFLNQCGSGYAQLIRTVDTAPVVSISGRKVLSTSTAAGLVLNADSYISTCTGTFSRKNLVYSWAAFRNGVQDISLTSISSEYSTYKLKPYSLSVNTLYSVALTVLETKTGKSSTDTVLVNVVATQLVAVITGGSTRSVLLGSTVTVDASNSYDMDLSGVAGAAAGLSFSWSCMQTAPTVSSTCGLLLPTSTTSSKLVLIASDASAATTSLLTVVVSDATRSVTASMTVVVQTADKPLLSILSSFPSKINAGRSLTITGSVRILSAATITWSINDTSVNINTAALSPVTQNLNAGLRSVTLLMASNTLSLGSSLSFRLSCTGLGGLTSMAAVTVTVNAPPQPGMFTISPLHGRELFDSFTMVASLWMDSDLPLSYSFAYLSTGGRMRNVQQLSPQSFSASILPAGQDINGYNVSCEVQVYDSFQANSSMLTIVKVVEVKLETSALADFLNPSKIKSDALTSSSTAALQILQTLSSIMNKQSCLLAPDCAALNRQPCGNVANTCGPCSQSGNYMGEFGSQNTKCVLNRGRSLSQFSESSQAACNATSSCSGWDECTRGICVTPNKVCANNCGGNGVCSYVSTDTGLPVRACLIGNTKCRTTCTCNAGYRGTLCITTDSTFTANQNLKLLLAISLSNATSSQDPSLMIVTDWISTAVALTKNYAELTPASTAVLSNILSHIITMSSTLALPYDAISDVLAAADGIIESLAQYSTITPAAKQMTYLLQAHSSFVLNQMTPNQYDVASLFSTFRSVNSVKPVMEGAITLSSTVSQMEVLSGVLADTLSMQTANEVTDVKIGMVVIRFFSLGSSLSSQLHSDPLLLMVPDLNVCTFGKCKFSVTMQSVVNATYTSKTVTPRSYLTTCGTKISSTVYACGNGLNVTAVCDGRPGIITTTCALKRTVPACGRLSSYATINDICVTTSYSSSQTTCNCTVPVVLFQATSALAVASPLFPGEVMDAITTSGGNLLMATSAVSITIQPPNSSPSRRPVAAGSLPYAMSTKEIVTIVMATLGGCFVFAVCLFFYINHRRKPTPWFAVVSVRKQNTPVAPMKVEVLEPAADNFYDSDWALPACKYRRRSELEPGINEMTFVKPDTRHFSHISRAIAPDFGVHPGSSDLTGIFGPMEDI